MNDHSHREARRREEGGERVLSKDGLCRWLTSNVGRAHVDEFISRLRYSCGVVNIQSFEECWVSLLQEGQNINTLEFGHSATWG